MTMDLGSCIPFHPYLSGACSSSCSFSCSSSFPRMEHFIINRHTGISFYWAHKVKIVVSALSCFTQSRTFSSLMMKRKTIGNRYIECCSDLLQATFSRSRISGTALTRSSKFIFGTVQYKIYLPGQV